MQSNTRERWGDRVGGFIAWGALLFLLALAATTCNAQRNEDDRAVAELIESRNQRAYDEAREQER